MKRYLSLFLALILSLSLFCACGPSEEGDEAASEFELIQTLDEGTSLQIRKDYIELIRHVDGNTNLLSLRVYGVFDQTVVLFLDEGWLTYHAKPRTEVVGEYIFEYPTIQSFRVYHDRRFYYLEDAWEDGYLTTEQVGAIYQAYQEGKYVSIPPTEESWVMGDDDISVPSEDSETDEIHPSTDTPQEPLQSVFYEVTTPQNPELSQERQTLVAEFLERYRRLSPLTEELRRAVESAVKWENDFPYGLSIKYGYYGTYHGYSVFCKSLNRNSEICEVSLGTKTFRKKGDFEFTAFRDGKFYPCTELYEQGILREEDVAVMADYHEVLCPLSEEIPPLSEDVLAEISQQTSEYDVKEIRENYLGTYQGYVVYHSEGILDVMDEYYFAGCYFYGNSLGLGAYKDGEFYGVESLYNSGMLSRESVQAICKQYNRNFQGGGVMLPLLDPLPEETVSRLEADFKQQTGRTLSLHEIDYYGTCNGFLCFFARTDQNEEDVYSGVYGYKDGIFIPLSQSDPYSECWSSLRLGTDVFAVWKRHISNQFGVYQ